ncbi:MAG: metal ABC transporter ATP-binding protein [Clostridiaceae bacterium]|jgi:zinc transport system ATP-binding protein|nr:metal ABC transporter ATP-binding protein [Clostridiaceae bacterium]
MIEKKFHENTCRQECCGLCCTKIEDFGVTIGSTVILENVNLHIHCGELTAIIGPNGAGKSTLIKALLGEMPHTGSLRFVQSNDGSLKVPIMGYVPQSINLDTSSPTCVLDLFLACRSNYPTWLIRSKKEVRRVKERLNRVKAGHLISRRLGALSGGEMQRVLLALALDPVPEILLLDEPVSGIDQNGLELFYETVSDLRKAYDLSIILVSHDLDLVRKYADRVVLLNKTVLITGSPEEVLNSDVFYDTFSLKWQKENRYKGGAVL